PANGAEIGKPFGKAGKLCAHFASGAADLVHLDVDKLRQALAQEVGRPMHDVAALCARQARPDGKRLLGGNYCRLYVGCITFRNSGDKTAIIWISHREGLARLSRAIRSVDKKTPDFRRARDFRHVYVSSPAPTV